GPQELQLAQAVYRKRRRGLAQAGQFVRAQAGEVGHVGGVVGRQAQRAYLCRDAQPAVVLHGARAVGIGGWMRAGAWLVVEHAHRQASRAQFRRQEQAYWPASGDDDVAIEIHVRSTLYFWMPASRHSQARRQAGGVTPAQAASDAGACRSGIHSVFLNQLCVYIMECIKTMRTMHSMGRDKMSDMPHDLNFLYLVDALYREGSVSAAARRLDLTQPAASHALNRLRARFGDPLFVRSGAGMTPTPTGERMARGA